MAIVELAALHDARRGDAAPLMPSWQRASRATSTATPASLQTASPRPHERRARGSGTHQRVCAFVATSALARVYTGSRAQSTSASAYAEYPAGHAGAGDIDSGPVLFGLGVSVTGFALAGARLHGDRQVFTELYRTVDLVGVPLSDVHGRHFMSGGPLGNAILLAMTGASFDWRTHCRGGAS